MTHILRPRTTYILGAALVLLAALGVWGRAEQAAGQDPTSAAFEGLPKAAESVDSPVVATVGGTDITAWRLATAVEMAERGGTPVSVDDALTSLVEYELLYREGVRLNLVPSDDEVRKAIEVTRENVPIAAVEEAVKYGQAGGSEAPATVEEYWAHPALFDATRKSMVVGRAREMLSGEVGPGGESRLQNELQRLRSGADVVVFRDVLESVR